MGGYRQVDLLGNKVETETVKDRMNKGKERVKQTEWEYG